MLLHVLAMYVGECIVNKPCKQGYTIFPTSFIIKIIIIITVSLKLFSRIYSIGAEKE